MKQTVDYLCVDDERNAETEAYLEFIKRQHAQLRVDLRLPQDFSTQVENLKRDILEHNFDGLILDLRLDGAGSPARYRAPALVQEIHTRAAENAFPVRPLVLWSNDQKLSVSYWPDDTSHDLFDLTIYKEKLAERDKPYAHKIARKMVSLAQGFNQIASLQSRDLQRVIDLLSITGEKAGQLDPRLFQPLTLSLSDTSVYDQARFIHRQLLATPNSALADTEILAARLGLDSASMSQAEFEALAEQLFPNARYQGVFAEGWVCWWMSDVEEAWQSLPGCLGPLRELTAEQRVACIQANTDRKALKIMLGKFLVQQPHKVQIKAPARPIELASSSSFWTVCQITRRPLDPMEGYVVDRQLYPWQLTQYVSMHGKLGGGKFADRVKVDALDWERYNEDRVIAKGTQQ